MTISDQEDQAERSDSLVEKNFNHSNECQFFRFNVREDFL
jgi:hypothetical protein